jgi:predicted secreted protein
MSLSSSWTRFTVLLIIWIILAFATITTALLMIMEIAEAYHLIQTINISTPYIEKLMIITHSSSHILMGMLYAIILQTLVILDIVVAKEMFKE